MRPELTGVVKPQHRILDPVKERTMRHLRDLVIAIRGPVTRCGRDLAIGIVASLLASFAWDLLTR